ncbi:MAG: cold shock domain-containing protein [Neisseria sp.]|uniref:cold shock domain-containing protein n=1 Tax=Neisseria sp. TaxID=192066 RepID=UPI0026DD8643|nr:cold shock domain-containing protein [Neisseria sp.]MDO4641147.1 cold shock domain-containing protein [Neisseria sp.]
MSAYYGKIVRWDDDRGFGFIREERSTAEVFVHISAFTASMPRPNVGERVIFDIVNTKTGRKEAKHVVYLDRVLEGRQSKGQSLGRRRSKYNNNHIVGVLLLIGVVIALFLFFDYRRNNRLKEPVTVEQVAERMAAERQSYPLNQAPKQTPQGHGEKAAKQSAFTGTGKSASFRCDGRTHCSQMTSCAEAKYFLANCPNVKMDGNHDGVPCERQWCHNG